MRALAETVAANSPAHHSSPGGEFRVPRSRLLRRPARIERDHRREVGWQPTHPSLLENLKATGASRVQDPAQPSPARKSLSILAAWPRPRPCPGCQCRLFLSFDQESEATGRSMALHPLL